MNPSIQATKAELRKRLKEAGGQYPASLRAAAAIELCRQASEHPQWLAARGVLLYAPLADEPDVRPLLSSAWEAGKIVALPRYDSDSGTYLTCQVSRPGELLTGRFGILEPASGCPVLASQELDVAFVPGLAFDLSGGRLGRGKGFYDRLLHQFPGHKCGVAFAWQLVQAVPLEAHDVRLNSILTPARWYPVSG